MRRRTSGLILTAAMLLAGLDVSADSIFCNRVYQQGAEGWNCDGTTYWFPRDRRQEELDYLQRELEFERYQREGVRQPRNPYSLFPYGLFGYR